MVMNAPNSPSNVDLADRVRAQYEKHGFKVSFEPQPGDLPAFMGSYRPDAIARKLGQNVAIEVKERNTATTQASLQQIRKLFEGQPDWRFDVMFMGAGSGSRIAIPPASPRRLRERFNELRVMVNDGQLRAAFVLAWPLLEGALHQSVPGTGNRPYTPGSVLQALAMNGLIEPTTEKRLRSLVDLRNMIVHGDLNVEPTREQVDVMLASIAETLTAVDA